MNVNELTPSPKEKVPFKLTFFKSVPKDSGCYILTTFQNDILYIGLATNLNNRFKQHLENPDKKNPTSDGKATWFYFTTFDSKNLPKLERTWLNEFTNVHGKLPVLNKVNSPIN